MTHKTSGNKYDYIIKDKEWVPDKETPEKVVLKLETALETGAGYEKVFRRNMNLKPAQLERKDDYIKNWIDELERNIGEEHKLPETGKVINAENSG